MDNRIEFAKVILILCIAIGLGAALSGCAAAPSTNYWGDVSAGVGKQLK